MQHNSDKERRIIAKVPRPEKKSSHFYALYETLTVGDRPRSGFYIVTGETAIL